MNLRSFLGARRRAIVRTTFPLWQKLGLHVVVNNYYSPIPDTRNLTPGILERRSALAGIGMREREQLALLERFAGSFRVEYESFPTSRPAEPQQYYYANDTFKAVDGAILYSIIRSFKPARVIEIGSGFSTLLMAQALARNRAEEGRDCVYTAVDPYPTDMIAGGVPGLTTLRRERVEKVPLSVFEELAAGDVLFIDSTHVIKTGGDVQYEYLEILPRLAPGVLVHSHDIFLPAEYPLSCMERGYFNTEQYLLQAFLSFNVTYEVLWASHFMHLENPEKLREAVSAYRSDSSLTCSMWIRRKD